MARQISLFIFCLIFIAFTSCSSEGISSVVSSKEEITEALEDAWERYDAHLSANPDSALYYLRKIESLATAVGDKKWQVAAYYGIAEIKLKKNIHDEAIPYFLKAVDGYKELEDLIQLAKVYLSIGNLYEKQNNFKAAIAYNKKANEILIYEGSSADKVKVLRNLGIYYYRTNEFHESEKSLLQAEKVSLSSNDFYLLGLVYNSFGMLHMKQENYSLAQEFFLKAVELSDSIPNGALQKSMATHNLGESYFLEGNYSEAKVWLQEAITVKLNFGDLVLTQSSYNLLAQIFIKENKYKEAVALLENGLKEIAPDAVGTSINESLTIINQALLRMNEEADPSEYPYLNKMLATYSGKLLAYNTRVSDLQENLENISQQQAVQAAIERYAFYEQLEVAEARQKKMGYVFLLPVVLLLGALVAIFMVLRRNRHYKELYGKVEHILNNSKALRHLK